MFEANDWFLERVCFSVSEEQTVKMLKNGKSKILCWVASTTWLAAGGNTRRIKLTFLSGAELCHDAFLELICSVSSPYKVLFLTYRRKYCPVKVWYMHGYPGSKNARGEIYTYPNTHLWMCNHRLRWSPESASCLHCWCSWICSGGKHFSQKYCLLNDGYRQCNC